MKQLYLFILLSLVLALVGCNSGQTTVTNPQAADVIDLTNLADEVEPNTVAALQGQDDVFIFDVREQEEYDQGHIPGITLIPMGQVPNRLGEIPKDKTVIVTCRSGNRSSQVAEFLRDQGYEQVHNMKGGILAWEKEGYPVEK